MPRHWNKPELKTHYERVKECALHEGFTEEELKTHYLDRLSRQTKSARITRMIHLAYRLGWLRGIADADEGFTPISLQ